MSSDSLLEHQISITPHHKGEYAFLDRKKRDLKSRYRRAFEKNYGRKEKMTNKVSFCVPAMRVESSLEIAISSVNSNRSHHESPRNMTPELAKQPGRLKRTRSASEEILNTF